MSVEELPAPDTPKPDTPPGGQSPSRARGHLSELSRPQLEAEVRRLRKELAAANKGAEVNALMVRKNIEKENGRISILCISILNWWQEHEFDTEGDRGDYNVYSEEPHFVSLARKFTKP